MVRPSRRWRWLFGLLVLSSGILMQTSCSSAAVDGIAGLASAITNQLIRNVVYEALGVSSVSSFGGLSGLTGSTGLGT